MGFRPLSGTKVASGIGSHTGPGCVGINRCSLSPPEQVLVGLYLALG